MYQIFMRSQTGGLTEINILLLQGSVGKHLTQLLSEILEVFIY